MQGCPKIAVVEQLPQPVELVFRFEKGLLAEDRRVLFIHSILDGPHDTFCRFRDASQMQRDELQMIGIDMPRLDEALGLLRAAAGVVRVDQAALAVHELVEVATGAGEALPEVVGGHLQDFAADRIAGSEDFAEREDQPLLAVEAEQHPGGAGDFGFFDQERHIDRHALRIGQIQVGGVVDGLGVAGESLRLRFSPPRRFMFSTWLAVMR